MLIVTIASVLCWP